MSAINLVLMGPPGSGKGTMTNMLRGDFPYKLICAGDILRAEKASGSKLGKKIAQIIDKGNLVPDEVIDELMFKEISKGIRIDESFLIDGYPRTVKQAVNLDAMINVPVVVWLNVSDETTIKRNLNRGLTSGRPDDANEDVIRQRLENFKSISLPVKEYYGKKIVEIDGEGTIDEVYQRIVDTLFENVREPKDISDII